MLDRISSFPSHSCLIVLEFSEVTEIWWEAQLALQQNLLSALFGDRSSPLDGVEPCLLFILTNYKSNWFALLTASKVFCARQLAYKLIALL